MITDFLKTQRSPDDLRIALEVLREFKAGETFEEWTDVLFIAWSKLEQLEEYLAHRVEGAPLEDDTIAYLKRHSLNPPT